MAAPETPNEGPSPDAYTEKVKQLLGPDSPLSELDKSALMKAIDAFDNATPEKELRSATAAAATQAAAPHSAPEPLAPEIRRQRLQELLAKYKERFTARGFGGGDLAYALETTTRRNPYIDIAMHFVNNRLISLLICTFFFGPDRLNSDMLIKYDIPIEEIAPLYPEHGNTTIEIIKAMYQDLTVLGFPQHTKNPPIMNPAHSVMESANNPKFWEKA